MMFARVPPAVAGPPGLLLRLPDGRRLEVSGRPGAESVTITGRPARLRLGVVPPAPGDDELGDVAAIAPWAAPRGAGPVRPELRPFARADQ